MKRRYINTIYIVLAGLCATDSLLSQMNDTLDVLLESEYYAEEIYDPVRVNLYEFSLSTHRPSGTFKDKLAKSDLVGFSLGFMRQLKIEQPAFLGVEVYHVHLGSLSRLYAQSVSNEVIDINGRVASNGGGFNFIGRYYPSLKLGPIEPLVELHFGGKWMYAYLSENGVFANDELYDNFDVLDSGFSMAFGGAVGLQVHLVDGLYLTTKGSYQKTNSMSYLRPLEDDPLVFPLLPEDGFMNTRSTTDVFRFDLGVTYAY